MTGFQAIRPKSSYLWLALPMIALIYGAMATFGSSDMSSTAQTFTVDASSRGGPTATFTNTIPDTVPTCADSGFPNTRLTCFTAGEILNRPGTGTNWVLMIPMIIVGIVGVLGFTKHLPWQGEVSKKTPKPPVPQPRERGHEEMLAFIPLVQIPAMEGGVAVVALVALLVGVALGAGGLYLIGFRKP